MKLQMSASQFAERIGKINMIEQAASEKVGEAPADGNEYVRKDGTWTKPDTYSKAEANETFLKKTETPTLDNVYTKAEVDEKLANVGSDVTSESVAQQISAALVNYVEKVTGKDLSSNDFTTVLKEKLEGLSNYDDTAVQESLTQLSNRLDTLVGTSASEAIDTFNEIEAFLQGITDTKTLTGLLAELKAEVVATIPTSVSQLTNDAGFISIETDPTVPDWAKQPEKPTYTAEEVGALSSVPQASDTVLGGVKIGYVQNEKNYPVELDAEGKAFVSVPWNGGSGGIGGGINEVTSMSNLPTNKNIIKISISKAGILSFADTPEDGTYYFVYIKNIGESDIIQSIPTEAGWQTDAANVTLYAGIVTPILISYVYNTWCVQTLIGSGQGTGGGSIIGGIREDGVYAIKGDQLIPYADATESSYDAIALVMFGKIHRLANNGYCMPCWDYEPTDNITGLQDYSILYSNGESNYSSIDLTAMNLNFSPNLNVWTLYPDTALSNIDGQHNTAKIIEGLGTDQNRTISKSVVQFRADDQVNEGFYDWYVPSIAQLTFLALKRVEIFDLFQKTPSNAFTTAYITINSYRCSLNYIASSTEAGSDTFWALTKTMTSISKYSKSTPAYESWSNTNMINWRLILFRDM